MTWAIGQMLEDAGYRYLELDMEVKGLGWVHIAAEFQGGHMSTIKSRSFQSEHTSKLAKDWHRHNQLSEEQRTTIRIAMLSHAYRQGIPLEVHSGTCQCASCVYRRSTAING